MWVCVRDYIALEWNLPSRGGVGMRAWPPEHGLMGATLESAPRSMWEEWRDGDFSFPRVTFKVVVGGGGFIMNLKKYQLRGPVLLWPLTRAHGSLAHFVSIISFSVSKKNLLNYINFRPHKTQICPCRWQRSGRKLAAWVCSSAEGSVSEHG